MLKPRSLQHLNDDDDDEYNRRMDRRLTRTKLDALLIVPDRWVRTHAGLVRRGLPRLLVSNAGTGGARCRCVGDGALRAFEGDETRSFHQDDPRRLLARHSRHDTVRVLDRPRHQTDDVELRAAALRTAAPLVALCVVGGLDLLWRRVPQWRTCAHRGRPARRSHRHWHRDASPAAHCATLPVGARGSGVGVVRCNGAVARRRARTRRHTRRTARRLARSGCETAALHGAVRRISLLPDARFNAAGTARAPARLAHARLRRTVPVERGVRQQPTLRALARLVPQIDSRRTRRHADGARQRRASTARSAPLRTAATARNGAATRRWRHNAQVQPVRHTRTLERGGACGVDSRCERRGALPGTVAIAVDSAAHRKAAFTGHIDCGRQQFIPSLATRREWRFTAQHTTTIAN